MMKRIAFPRVASLVGAISLTLAAGAGAFDAQEFSPAVDPEAYFSVYSSRTAPAGRFHVALWYNYAKDPVVADVILGQRPSAQTKIVSDLHTIDMVGSYSLSDQIELGVDVPFSDVKSQLSPPVSETTGLDDIRLLGKVQLLDNRASRFGVALVPFVDLPSGEANRLTSNGKTNYGILGVTDFVHERFRSSLNFGYKVNNKPFSSSDESDEILFGLGAGLLAIHNQPLFGGIFDNAEILAEVFGSTAEQKIFQDEENTPLEGLGGFRLYGPSGFYVTRGIGKSITQSINGAALRIVASIGYTPPPPPPPPPAPPAAPPPPPAPLSKVVVTDEQIVTLSPIFFDFDKDTIKPVSYAVLDQVAQVMRDRSSAVVRVEGHTDSFGTDSYNQQLSERRARSVVRYLIAKGIPGERLEAVGFGESRPIASNDTAQGRAKNRRTEFHIVREVR